MPKLERALREQQQYDQGVLQRGLYDRVLSHCSTRDMQDKAIQLMQFAHNKRVLEVGSSSWKSLIDGYAIRPMSIDAINISESELATGRELAKNASVKPRFHHMDAHKLEFDDQSFDMVIGGAILHHLDLPIALKEINRVLKPNGRILFVEPLDINPVAKFVRLLTPKSRTIDEQPFRLKEIRLLQKHFRADIHCFQFSIVPIGIISGLLFKRKDNFLIKSANSIDRNIAKIPGVKYLFRQMLIDGSKKTA